MEQSNDTGTVAELTLLIAGIASADHPYWASMAVTAAAPDAMLTSPTAGQLYLMWAALQDWYELREGDAAEVLECIRRAAVEWPDVKDDPENRSRYFETWNSTIRAVFDRPATDAPPATVLGPMDGRVVGYDEAVGVGFIRADDGGPTYCFRWDEIKIDAFFKTLKIGVRVRFEARVSHAGERFAVVVSPRE